MLQAGIAVYLLIYLITFFCVSKKNGTYFNAYTVGMGYTFLLQGVTLFIFSFNGELEEKYSAETLILFVSSLIIGILAQYSGYALGFQYNVKTQFLKQESSAKQTQILLFSAIGIFSIAFILLGIRGVGLYAWIFDTRNAYIIGRAGNGIYYLLFEMFLSIALVCAVYYRIKHKRKGLTNLLIILLAGVTYFTGSKQFILAAGLLLVFVFDMFIKKIKIFWVVGLCLVGVIGVSVLLKLQSGVSLLDYVSGDFYYNYLNEIEALNTGAMSHYFGQLLVEDIVYSFIPRSIFPAKPFVYGTSRLPAFFFGEASVIAGNTPSFSSYGRAYADFGLIGVFVESLIIGLATGMAEKTLRKSLNRQSFGLFSLILYNLLFITSIPMSNFLIIVIVYCYYIYSKIFIQKGKKKESRSDS